jgi:hypothetical protein
MGSSRLAVVACLAATAAMTAVEPATGQAAAAAAQSAPPGNTAAAPPAGTPDQGNAATYPSPTSPGNAASPAQSADPQAAARQHRREAMRTAAASGNTGSINPGMALQTKAGQSAGSVVEVVRQASGRPAYVVIDDGSGRHKAITYEAARLMVHGNSLIVDTQRLQGAPVVPADAAARKSPAEWQGQADRYWSTAAGSGN